MKTTLVYGFFFILGMAYIMMLISWTDWPPRLVFPFILGWAALVAYLARCHYRRAVQHRN